MNEFKTTAPVVQPLGVSSLPEPYIDRSEETNGVVYYGWAPLGVDEADEGWRLMKETTSEGVTKREYPYGSMEFKFKWSERANYSYGR